MAYNDEWKEELRARADLVAIVSQFTKLKKSGKTFRGPCPLHKGEDPNFSVDGAKGAFKCFVCGEGGDLYSFVMKVLGVDFMDAARWIAERSGFEIPRGKPRRLEADERTRAERQANFGGDARALWRQLGIDSGITLFHLGATRADTPELRLPIWGEEDQSVPGGWLRYQVEEGRPKSLGLDEESRESIAGALFRPSGALTSAQDDLLLYVVDPIVAIRMHESGYHAVFSVVREELPADGPWVTADQLRLLTARSRTSPERIGLVVPTEAGERDFRKALYATEIECLSAGIQPVWVEAKGDDAPLYGWSLATMGAKALRACLEGPGGVRDVFGMRVDLLAPRAQQRGGQQMVLEKIAPSLRAVREGNPLLYEAYVAWATKHLGATRVHLESVVLGLEGDAAPVAF